MFEPQQDTSESRKWTLVGFYAESARQLEGLRTFPEMASYFDDPKTLVFDPRQELLPDWEHLLDDKHKDRYAKAPCKTEEERQLIQVLVKNERNLRMQLDQAIQQARERVRRNYKIAVPQWYFDQLQFLLPLCLFDAEHANVALVVERHQDCYRGNTVLTLDAAYNNARLIAKPDREWLSP